MSNEVFVGLKFSPSRVDQSFDESKAMREREKAALINKLGTVAFLTKLRTTST